MKPIYRNTTSVILMLLLMVSTLQLSIYKMDCLMSGQSKISLSDFEDCNSTPNDDCSVTQKCCCFHQLDLNFDFDTNLNPETLAKAMVVVRSVELATITHFESHITANDYTNLSPPGGFEFLKKIQVYRL